MRKVKNYLPSVGRLAYFFKILLHNCTPLSFNYIIKMYIFISRNVGKIEPLHENL